MRWETSKEWRLIHFRPAKDFATSPTACGITGRAPAAKLWRWVDCLDCLAKAPKDPRIDARREEVIAEAKRRAEQDG